MKTVRNGSGVGCHVSGVTCHVSRVTCHVSGVTCHVSGEPQASRITPHAPRSISDHSLSTIHCPLPERAFTLIELLVVITIMGLLAALAMPAFNKLKPNVMAAATQKLLTDVGRARQLAIAQHTTVLMVFVPPGFWTNDAAAYNALTPNEVSKAQKLWDKQMVGYTFVSLRSIGDQPGQSTLRYLDSWRTLPEGTFIPWQKFFGPAQSYFTNSSLGPGLSFTGGPFNWTNAIPFPSETAPRGGAPQHWVWMPYIGFNYLGQLVDASGQPTGRNELIPLSQGNVLFTRDSTRASTQGVPGIQETPPGNTTNTFNVINIDWLTGRARVERQEVF